MSPRLAKQPKQAKRQRTTKPLVPRGLTERQWVIGLLVVSGLLLLATFRGCILPSGVGPKAKPSPSPSAVATAAPTTAPTNQQTYTVESGDSLSRIAQKVGVSLDALLQANGLNRNSILQVGQQLRIP